MRMMSLLIVLLLFTGCQNLNALYGGYSVDELTYSDKSSGAKLLKSIKTDETSNIPPGKIQTGCLAPNPASTIKTDCIQQRNTVIATLLIQSDEMCQEHIKSIYGNEAAMNIGAGSITNLASGLATVLAAPATKSALSAVAFFSSAEQSLINETVYKNLLTPAVVKKIREARNAKADKFITHFNDPIKDYSVQQALWDVTRYHQTCSFMYGLRKALEEGEKLSVINQIARLEKRVEQLTDKKDARETERTGKKDKDGNLLDPTQDTTYKLYDKEIKAAQTKLQGLNRSSSKTFKLLICNNKLSHMVG